MASDDWLYNDDLDVSLPGRGRLDTDTQGLDGEDLLDDMLTAPSASNVRTDTPTNEDELLGVSESHGSSENILEDSGSARYNADRKAKTVQARIDANLTSQGVVATGGLAIFSREPNRKNSVFVGNMNWWATDLHVIAAVKELGLGEVTCLKFFENRANGQSKGYCLAELSSESLALSAVDKLSNVEIHDRKLMVAYALRISPHQFESRCNVAKEQGTAPVFTAGPAVSGAITKTNTVKTSLSSVIPPVPNPIFSQPPRPPMFPGFPTPPLVGLRPPGLPDLASFGLPGLIPPPFPHIPTAPGINPFAARAGGLPTGPPIPPAALAALGSAGAVGAGDPAKLAAPHLNPAFFHDMGQGGPNMAEMLVQAAARFKNQNPSLGGHGSPGDRGKPLPNHPSDEEISETNQRNKAISSSAITRAMSDAQAGDYEGAIDTLRMAITLIKQSVTAGSEASQIMIQSLQDCLQGMEQQQQSMHNKRYRSSGGMGGGGGEGGGGGGGGGRGRDHMTSRDRHMHEMMREREMREFREIRDMRDFHDDRGVRSAHKMKHHRDRSRERRR